MLQVYKNAGCLSAPFHWPLRRLHPPESREKQGVGMVIDEMVERAELSPELKLMHASQKYYIDVGEFDNDYMPSVDEHNYSDWVVDQLSSRLHVERDNILYFRNVLGAGNSYTHHTKHTDNRMLDRLKLPLLAFLKPEGGVDGLHPRAPVVLSEDYAKRSDDLVLASEEVVSSVSSLLLDNIPERHCKDLLPEEPKAVPVSTYLICIG